MSGTLDRPRPSLFELLRKRAAAEGREPWLFHRRGWAWKWCSWGQAADQVARGAAALEDVAADRIAFEDRLDPDALCFGLAIRAAGKTAVATAAEPPPGTPLARRAPRDGDAVVSGRGMRHVDLPRCRDRLERWHPEALRLDAMPGCLVPAPGAEALATRTLDAEARRFAGLLPDLSQPGKTRPILCASPLLGAARVQALLAWTVQSGAAWLLEPAPEAFEEAVLWARPTILVATADELRRLGARIATRPHRRHRRLRAVIAVDRLAGRIEPWPDLGVRVVDWTSADHKINL